MGLKVDYDTDTRLVVVTEAPVVPAGAVIAQQTLDVEIDLYSDGKEDWLANVSGTKRGSIFPWLTAVSAGSPLPGGRTEPAFFRFRNDLGWRLFPFDVDHELTLLGNFVPADANLPVIAARPGRTILVFRDGAEVAGLSQQSVRDSMELSSTNGQIPVDTKLNNNGALTGGLYGEAIMGFFDSSSTTESGLTVPSWMDGMAEDVTQGMMDLLEQPLMTPEEQVAAYTENERTAQEQMAAYGQEGGQGAQINDALFGAGMGGLDATQFGQEAIRQGLDAGPAMNMGVNMDNVGNYINNDLLSGQIDAASRDVMRQFSEQDAPASRMAQALSGNTGSTRGAIGDAILQRGAEDRIGDISSAMRGNAYSQALGIGANEASQNAALANSGLDRQIQGGSALFGTGMDSANLLNQANSMGLQNMDLMMQSGAMDRAYQQSLNDAAQRNYQQQWTNQMNANNMVNQNASTFGTHTSTTTDTPSMADQVGQVAGMAMMFSDPAMKENVEFDQKFNGFNFYNFNWKDSGEPGYGVMADEVQQTHPHLVKEIDGKLAVNYEGVFECH